VKEEKCLRRVLKMLTDDVDLKCCAKLFQRRGQATGNARSPYVDELSNYAQSTTTQYQTNDEFIS